MARRSKKELMEELDTAFRTAQNRSQAFDELVAKRLGINLTDLRCLDIIERLRPTTAGRLAEEAGLTTGAVTAIIDRLEEAGYARRVADPADRRRVRVELTEEAEREVWKIYGPLKEEWERVLSRFSVAELERFIEMMSLGEEVGERQLEHLRSLGVERLPAWQSEPRARSSPPSG